jgi:hypothetical protein
MVMDEADDGGGGGGGGGSSGSGSGSCLSQALREEASRLEEGAGSQVQMARFALTGQAGERGQ